MAGEIDEEETIARTEGGKLRRPVFRRRAEAVEEEDGRRGGVGEAAPLVVDGRLLALRRQEEGRHRHEATADRIGREAEPLERVGAKQHRRPQLAEHHERDRGALADTHPRMPDVPLDLASISQH